MLCLNHAMPPQVDIDTSWQRMGLDDVRRCALARRPPPPSRSPLTLSPFVLRVEIDGSWGGVHRWNVSQVDQLAWLAARHGYASYIKIRCKAIHALRDPRRM